MFTNREADDTHVKQLMTAPFLLCDVILFGNTVSIGNVQKMRKNRKYTKPIVYIVFNFDVVCRLGLLT